MTINELQQEERIALGGLLRLIIRSDGDFTVAEEETVNQLGEKHLGGAGELWRVISASAQACPNDAAIRESAAKVTRPEARAVIFGLVREVAAGDEVSPSEETLIGWLESLWK
jgi:uncharacterized tellurite resistance protein B-like protein